MGPPGGGCGVNGRPGDQRPLSISPPGSFFRPRPLVGASESFLASGRLGASRLGRLLLSQRLSCGDASVRQSLQVRGETGRLETLILPLPCSLSSHPSAPSSPIAPLCPVRESASLTMRLVSSSAFLPRPQGKQPEACHAARHSSDGLRKSSSQDSHEWPSSSDVSAADLHRIRCRSSVSVNHSASDPCERSSFLAQRCLTRCFRR